MAETHQAFLRMIRTHWHSWNIVLFEDRGSLHTAEESQKLAVSLGIEIRFLPRATSELNAMDHLWRAAKGRGVVNRKTVSIDDSADKACQHILKMSRPERLQKVGILSGNFWLTTWLLLSTNFLYLLSTKTNELPRHRPHNIHR